MIQRFLLLLLIFLSVQISAQNTPLTQPVVIIHAGPSGADELGAGIITGELNGRLYVVTAHHVVKNFQDQISVQLAGYPQNVSARIERSEPGLDLAILSVGIPDGYTPSTSFAWATQIPRITEEVIVVGHPNGVLWDINRVVRIKEIYFDTLGSRITLYDNGLDNGNSGGAVLTQDNQLIAMVQEVSGSQVTCLGASSIQRILEESGFSDNLMTPASYTNQYAGDMIWVEGGSFIMGSNDGEDDEKPQHEVSLDGYWMGKYEVTNEQFCAFLNEIGNQEEEGATWLNFESFSCGIIRSGGRYLPEPDMVSLPISVLNWYGAKAYTLWVSEKTGQTYQLPTEAQWEYAARGGQNSRNSTYAGSNSYDRVGWFSPNSNSDSHPVGQKAPNELGLYDMSGNVWEWCIDWFWSDYYAKSPTNNPLGPEEGYVHVIRGGGWDDSPEDLRVTYRNYERPILRSEFIGFRLSRTP